MKLLKLSWMGLIALVFFACQKNIADAPEVMAGAAKKTPTDKYSPVSISCVSADQTTITLSITAGATGAPAGFSIQWMPQATLDALNGVWPASDDLSLCKASFSGKAYGNSYALAAGASATITLGDLLAEFDNGGSIKGNNADCEGPFTCGTQYAFRAFAHADSAKNKSDLSYGACETASCDESCGRHWLGWWKQSENFLAQTFMPEDTSAATFMQVGTRWYSANQILSILNQPPQGNGLVILAHQLLCAKLNVLLAGGSNDAIATGDAAIGNKTIPPVGTDDLKYNTINLPQLVGQLHAFNNCKE